MEYGKVYSEKKKMPKKPMERIYVMLFFVCMVLFVIIISNNMQTEKHKNIFYYNGEKVKLTNEIEREKKNETQKDEYVYFITMADIKNIFDNNLIYEETKGQIITTNDTHVGMLTIDNNIMNLNGSEVTLPKAPYKKQGKVFIPIDAIKDIYELDVKTYENKVAVFSKSKKYEIFKLKSEEKLKSIPSLIGGDITNVSNTENLIYIGKQSGFIKGMTEKIEVGYIQENKIETKTVIREDYKEEEKKNVNIITNYNDYKMNFENVKKDNNKTNIALVSNFIIKENGNIQIKYDKNNKSYSTYFSKLVEENIIPYGHFVLEENKESEIIGDLVTFEKRNTLITNILKTLSEYNMKGLVLEVKNVQDTRAFIRFVTELKPRLKETGKKLVMPNDNILSDTIRKMVDYTY